MKRILSFGAHPDDIEIGCGGAEIKAIENGYEVFHVVMTSGEAGSQTIPKEQLAKTRETEARAAASFMGVSDVFFLNLEDGLTVFNRENKMDVIRLIRDIKPEIIFTHGSFEQFPDHRICHQLVMDAITGSCGPWFQEVQSAPWSPDAVLGYEVWNPMQQFAMAVPITKQLNKKVAALMEHKSQLEGVSYQKAVEGLAGYRGIMSFTGDYAEVYEVLKLSSQYNLSNAFSD